MTNSSSAHYILVNPMPKTLPRIASLLAAVTLCVLAFLPRPDFPFAHADILSGAQLLSAAQREAYSAYVRLNLAFDSVYLLLQILVWCGLGTVLAHKSPLTAALVLLVGTCGVCLDFAENSIRWGFLTLGSPPSATLAAVWSAIYAMSFWLMVIAAVVASSACWSPRLLARLSAMAGLLAIPAAALTFSVGFKSLFFWMIAWHLVIGLFLLQPSDKAAPATAA